MRRRRVSGKDTQVNGEINSISGLNAKAERCQAEMAALCWTV